MSGKQLYGMWQEAQGRVNDFPSILLGEEWLDLTGREQLAWETLAEKVMVHCGAGNGDS